MAEAPAVLVVGAASRDLDDADPRGWRLGGGVTYGALAVARLGLPTRALVGADDEATTAHELDLLRASGVELRVVPLASGPVFDNRPTTAAGRRAQVAIQASEMLPLSALPAEWRHSPAVVLAPVAGELGAEWSAALPPAALAGLGWQGLFRRLSAGQRVEALPIAGGPLVARADLAVVSAEDAVAGGAPIAELLGRPGQQLVITHGHRPALHIARRADGWAMRLLSVRPARRIGDPTGAGDVLLATWVASLAALTGSNREPGRRVLGLAISAAEAKVECRRLEEMPDLRAICARMLRPRD